MVSNNNMINRKNIFRVLTIIWMIIIFSFSARTGKVSTGDSNRAGLFIGRTFIAGFDEWNEDKQILFAEKIDHPVRKIAHASEYAVLGVLLTGACIYRKRCNKDTKKEISAEESCRFKYIQYRFISSRYQTAWFFGTIYASLDEFHQLFVPGRSGQITDVIIDSTGVLVGVLVYWMIGRIKKIHS